MSEGGQTVVPWQACQGQSAVITTTEGLRDGHSYVLLLKVCCLHIVCLKKMLLSILRAMDMLTSSPNDQFICQLL